MGSIGNSSSSPAISISLPGVDNHDTERRRQIALKALKDRLSKTEEQSTMSEATKWPSLEEADDKQPSSASTHQPPSPDEQHIDIEAPQSAVNEDDKQPLLEKL